MYYILNLYVYIGYHCASTKSNFDTPSKLLKNVNSFAVGNEHGFAYKTPWSPLLRDSLYGGIPEYHTKYAFSQENGTHWVSTETDVSIHPNGYYHTSEDNKVKALKGLLDIYYTSIGRNSTILVNFPIDRKGLVHKKEEKQFKKITAQLKKYFAHNLTLQAKMFATNVGGNSSTYKSEHAVDGNKDPYWTVQ